MSMSAELIKKLDGIDPRMREVLLSVIEEIDQKTRVITVGRGEFEELKDAVKELVLIQKETIRHLTDLTIAQKRTEARVQDLAEAQKASEARLTRLEETVQDLAEAQKASEARLTRLEETVQGLIEAQKASEARLTRLEETVQGLIEAQKASEARLTRLEETVQDLAEAQKRTERALRELIEDHKDLKKQVGGLAMSVGYGLEDKLIPHLRRFAGREFGIEVTVADRRNVIYDSGRFDEVNFYCEGTRDGARVYLIGEAKAQPGKKDFEALDRKLERLKAALKGDMEAFLVGYQFDPGVEAFAQKRYPHIRRFRTFEVEAVNG